MSSIDIDLACLVSPTLRRRRSRSTKQAVRTREHMATVVAQGKGNSRRLRRATPFIDEDLEDEGGPGWGWGPWIALLLVCASTGTGFIIFTALQST